MNLAPNPISEFENRVTTNMASGMSEMDAVRQTARGDRELHRRYLLAVNKRGRHHYAARRLARQPVKPAVENPWKAITEMARRPGNPISAYEVLLSRLTSERGLSHRDARCWIATHAPEAHKSYVDCCNRLHGRSGRLER